MKENTNKTHHVGQPVCSVVRGSADSPVRPQRLMKRSRNGMGPRQQKKDERKRELMLLVRRKEHTSYYSTAVLHSTFQALLCLENTFL